MAYVRYNGNLCGSFVPKCIKETATTTIVTLYAGVGKLRSTTIISSVPPAAFQEQNLSNKKKSSRVTNVNTYLSQTSQNI
jgi:hypothetical protein